MGPDEEPAEAELFWGDEPADVLDQALNEVVAVFQELQRRNPTKDEMRAGLEFAPFSSVMRLTR